MAEERGKRIEPTVDSIREIISRYPSALAEIRRGFDDLHDALQRRLESLEETVRRHSAILDKRIH